MSGLDPELKQLMKKARQRTPDEKVEAPYGFAGRVVTRWQNEKGGDGLSIWLRFVSVSAKVSAVLILSGALFFAAQFRNERDAYDITTVYKLSASNFAP